MLTIPHIILGSVFFCISQQWSLRVVLFLYQQRHFCHNAEVISSPKIILKAEWAAHFLVKQKWLESFATNHFHKILRDVRTYNPRGCRKIVSCVATWAWSSDLATPKIIETNPNLTFILFWIIYGSFQVHWIPFLPTQSKQLSWNFSILHAARL